MSLYSTHKAEKPKEPPVAAGERFMACVLDGDINAIYNMLDPNVFMTTPMGLNHGRPDVKCWIAFDTKVMKECNATIKVGACTGDEDSLKTARSTWSIGALTFTDVIVLNQMLLIKSIRRTMVRRAPRDAAEKALTSRMLLAWTGPHFAKYCCPKAVGVDNRALVLPVLDYTYHKLTRVRQLLTTCPKGGRPVTDPGIVRHHIVDLENAKAEEKRDKATQQASKDKFGIVSKDEITIRATNRDGDHNAIIIDRHALVTAAGESRVESLEDSEVAGSTDRLHFVASGLRLTKNELTSADELDQVIRLTIINAFHFLTWVDLSCNMLKTIPDLSQYPIVVLYLHDNRIPDGERSVQDLCKLTQLQSLTLFGNPLQSDAPSARDYKFRVLSAVRGAGRKAADVALKTFDHSVLSASDKSNIDRFAASAARPASGRRSPR
jgi:hypothetical protein